MINWGILGTGVIAKAFAHSIKDAKDCILYGVASRSSSNAKQFAQEFKCNSFEGYKNLIEDPSVDAIYIALPHNYHFEFTLSALNHKKSVLCEKPMTINSEETMTLIDLARKNKTLLMEAFMYRTHPQTLKIKEIIKQDFANEPIEIEASFGFEAKVSVDHRLLNPDLGGGSILDIGCYPMSFARMIVGIQEGKLFANPSSIEAKGTLSPEGIDLFSSANLEFTNGSKAFISCAINQNLSNSVLISSRSKSLQISQPWNCGEFEGRQSNLIFSKDNESIIIKINENLGVFTHEINHFVNLIKSGFLESSLVSHADSLGNMSNLDRWRGQLGVSYKEDHPENRTSNPFLKLNENPDQIMPTLKLKGIDVEPSRLVFGCDNQLSRNHAFHMFDHFFSLGGNIFDTAYIYNDGKSDNYLGNWIKHRNIRNKIIVLGKGAHTPYCNPESIRPQLEESLSRLMIDSMDIYCLHRDNLDVPVSEFIDALNELKNEGLIKLIGASNWSLNRFRDALDYAQRSKLEPFTVLSNNFSLARMIEPVWPGCESSSDESFKSFLQEKQIFLLPWSSQARGFFLDSKEFESQEHISNPDKKEQERVWHNENNLERRRRCFVLAEQKEVEPIQIALAFCLAQSFPTLPLVGPRNIFETQSSFQSLFINLSQDEVAWLDLSLKEI
ncbi:MAG: aldo/keto reductase [SAR86 cluster bacterium]|nr:aldo/keto reductase [SAR86 cluster bacterium]